MLSDYEPSFGADIDFWGFEYLCGLKIAYLFLHFPAHGLIYPDSPEIEHALRHLPFQTADLILPTPDTYQVFIADIIKYCPDRRQEIAALKAFQVWRIDDNGNVFTVGEPTSERDAHCLVQQYEARGHKQMYWVASVR